MIDENALKTATEPYGVTIYLTDVRDIIEAYEAAKSTEQPVGLTVKQQLEAQICLAGDCAPEDTVIHTHNVFAILQRPTEREVSNHD